MCIAAQIARIPEGQLNTLPAETLRGSEQAEGVCMHDGNKVRKQALGKSASSMQLVIRKQVMIHP